MNQSTRLAAEYEGRGIREMRVMLARSLARFFTGTMAGVPVPIEVRGGLDRGAPSTGPGLASDACAALDSGSTFGGSL